jgi:putative ATP-binding cassette transporter
MIVLVVLAGLLSGACNAGLLALINTALHSAGVSLTPFIWRFAGLGLVKLVTSALSRVLLARFSHRTIADLRLTLSRKILDAPLPHVEVIGIPRILVALTDDIQDIRAALLSIPSVALNTAILLGCAVYLGWLSWKVLLFLLGFLVLGAGCYRVLGGSAFQALKHAREAQDTLFRHVRALLEGLKELKLHGQRREAFLSHHMCAATDAHQHHSIVAMTRFIMADSLSQLVFYVPIGLLLFALPFMHTLSPQILTGYVLTTLYMIGPLGALMNALPFFGRAIVALQKVEALGLSLTAGSTEENVVAHPASIRSWERLELQDVVYAYPQELGDGHFTLGPLRWTLYPGELIFLSGGNGSGKSTLVKLLTGLYAPNAGEIRLDGQPITDANREWYRQLFSVVFSDFYLFESLLGLASAGLDAQAQHYLEQLQLDHKIQVTDGVLSTTALSQGERKRLALLTAYLEDRHIYVFDEWAADQDPQFKDIFYTTLLPALQAKGKTVLVISHDERYFFLADRLLKLDDGTLVDCQYTRDGLARYRPIAPVLSHPGNKS